MSSPIYEVSVVSVEDNEAVLRVTLLENSVEELPLEANFAVQAIIEAWDLAIHEEFDGEINPVDPAKLKRRAENSPFRKQFERWVSYMYGGTREITVAEYRDLEKNFIEDRHRFPSNLSRWETTEDGKYVMILDPLDSAVMDVSDDQILDCSVRNDDLDDEGRPTAEMVFTVDDDGILSHLIEGTTWETDRYDLFWD